MHNWLQSKRIHSPILLSMAMSKTSKQTKQKSSGLRSIRQLYLLENATLISQGEIYIEVQHEYELKSAFRFHQSFESSGFRRVSTIKTIGNLEASVYMREQGQPNFPSSVYDNCEFIIEIAEKFVVKLKDLAEFFAFGREFLAHPIVLPKIEKALDDIASEIEQVHYSINAATDAIRNVSAVIGKQ